MDNQNQGANQGPQGPPPYGGSYPQQAPWPNGGANGAQGPYGAPPQVPPPPGPPWNGGQPPPKNRKPLIIGLAVGGGVVVLALLAVILSLLTRTDGKGLTAVSASAEAAHAAGWEEDTLLVNPPAGLTVPVVDGEVPPLVIPDGGTAVITNGMPPGIDFEILNISNKTATYSEFFCYCYDETGSPAIGADGTYFEWVTLTDSPADPGDTLYLAEEPPWDLENSPHARWVIVICSYVEFEDGSAWGLTNPGGTTATDAVYAWADTLSGEAQRMVNLVAGGAGQSTSQGPPTTTGAGVVQAFEAANENPGASIKPSSIALYPDGFFLFTWQHREAGNVYVYGDYRQNGDEVHCIATDGSFYGSSVYGFVEELTFRFTPDGALEFVSAVTPATNFNGVGELDAGTILHPAAAPQLVVNDPRLLGNYLDALPASAALDYPLMLTLSPDGQFHIRVANLHSYDLDYELSGDYRQEGDLITLTLSSWVEEDYLTPSQRSFTFQVQGGGQLVYRGETLVDFVDGTVLAKVPPLASGENRGIPAGIYRD